MPGLKRTATRHAGQDGQSSGHKKVRTQPSEMPISSSSLVTAQGPDFPRGGGSNLTPFEHKQALNEVSSEAKRRRDTLKDARVGDDDNLFKDSKRDRQRAVREKKNAQRKKRDPAVSSEPRKKDAGTAEVDGRQPRVEVLNYKRLTVGTRLLCSVLAVHPLALVLSLPNQLVGHVPITSISELLTERLESMTDSDAGEGDDDDQDDEKGDKDEDEEPRQADQQRKGITNRPPELRDLFKVGQWVQASVQALHPAGAYRRSRGREGGDYEQDSQRVELTLDPSTVNEGVSVADLSKGFLLSLTVKSREDHGFLMDACIDGANGFINYKDAGAVQLEQGQVVLASISSVEDNRRSFSATLETVKVSSAALSVAPNASALLPGNLVSALVTATSAAGLNVKLFGMFDATIDPVHLDHDVTYAIGQRIRARILWEEGAELNDVRVDVAKRKIGLSAAPSIVSLSSPSVLSQEYPVGARVRATVVSTIEDWGLMCQIRGSDVRAFTHISACADDHVVALPTTQGPFRIGTVHAGRVVGHALTDEIVQLSFQKSVLERAFMRVSEVMVGQVIRATVRLITPQAIMLDINGSVDGVVFPAHFSDIPLKRPEKKYKVGQTLSARVLKVEPNRQRVAMTLKRTLVETTLPIIASMQDARVGVVTHGVVGRILEGNMGPSAILVDLFGSVRVFVPASEAFEANASGSNVADTIRTTFFIGKCVKVRLTRVDYESGRITASIRQTSDNFLKRLNVDAVHVGQNVVGKLAAVHQDVVVLELQPSSVRALLGLKTLAKERRTTLDALRRDLSEGEIIDNLKVIDKKADRGIVIVGGTQSFARLQKTEVTPNSIVTARVARHENNAAILHVGHALRCRLHATDCRDDYGDKDGSNSNSTQILPSVGADVPVFLLNVRGNTNKRAEVSIRPSRLHTAADGGVPVIRDREINDVAGLSTGDKVRGFVKAKVDKAGLFVDLGRNVTARVKISELFDAFVKDWLAPFSIGQLVEGTVMEIDAARNKVEMSLRKNPTSKSLPQPEIGVSSLDSSMKMSSIKEGTKVTGFVRALADFGVFVQIEGTPLSGLAHKSQLSDDTDPDLAVKAFSVGDRVKALILRVDRERKKISFGLKPSLFSREDFFDSESEADTKMQEHVTDKAEDSGNGSADSDIDLDSGDLDGHDNGEDDGDSDSDNESNDEVPLSDSDEGEEYEEQLQAERDSMSSDASRSMDNLDAGFVDTEVPLTSTGLARDGHQSPPSSLSPALRLTGGFAWTAGTERDAPEEDSMTDSDSSGIEHRGNERGGLPRKRTRKQTQEDMTADLSSKLPESAQDYERLLLGSPNSSFLWIQFVSFHVQLGDVAKAREVARRALQVIHFREEQEKFNVWIALLNLENTYGNDESLDSTFKEACAFNDPKAIHLRLADIFEQNGKIEAAQEHWKRTAKKFGFSSKVWVGYHRFLLRCTSKEGDDARVIIARSMQSLEKRKHVKTITAYALDEFKLGDPERGRTIFEGLVDSYPKRLDIWWQYIDQETKVDHPTQVRGLFERILAMKQSSKKVKAVLKKWLEFEKRHGNGSSQQSVLERARQFVEERERLVTAANEEAADGHSDAESDGSSSEEEQA